MPGETGVIRPPLSFQAHIDVLQAWLRRREAIVERVQGLLNAQRRPAADLRDPRLLDALFEECVLADGEPGEVRLWRELDDVHLARGFAPRDIAGLHNGLADPVEMLLRAFHLWQQTRWPGRNGRVRYARTLVALEVLRRLTMLSLRIWDDDVAGASGRLSQLQAVLDTLRDVTPPDQPVLVRDARWLIPLAQSPATDDLGAYFTVAEQVATGLPGPVALEVHAAGVRMAAGHLRSQTRYYSQRLHAPIDDRQVLQITRTSNALDLALLVQDLVPVLDAYERAVQTDDAARADLADVICQGLSVDPDLCLNHPDLLAAYGIIEDLFVEGGDDGGARWSSMGRRHLHLLEQFDARLARLAPLLVDECRRGRPVAGAYSPYGVLYGFSTNLLEHIAFKCLQPDQNPRFGLEDVFVVGDTSAERLAWVDGLRRLPHLAPDVEAQFAYPHAFAEAVFERLERALRRRVASDAPNVPGRLFIAVAASDADAPVVEVHAAEAHEEPVSDGPMRPGGRFIVSSDRRLAAAGAATLQHEARVAAERREGRCLVSYRTPGGSVAVSKDVLMHVAAGQSVTLSGIPPAAAQHLALMYPRLADLHSRS